MAGPDVKAGRAGLDEKTLVPEEGQNAGSYKLYFGGSSSENYQNFRAAAKYLLADEEPAKHPKMLNRMLGSEPLSALAANMPDDGYPSMSARWAVLDESYGNEAAIPLAWEKLERLKQGATPLADFIIEFEQLTGLCKVSKEQKAFLFRTKVVSGLGDRLRTSGAADYSAMKRQAWLSNEDVIREYKRTKTTREVAKKNTSTGGQTGNRNGGNNPRARGAQTSGGDRPPIVCWTCDQEGHTARNCTSAEKATKTRARAGKSEARTSKNGEGRPTPTVEEPRDEIREFEEILD
jgi:hypothetical protein